MLIRGRARIALNTVTHISGYSLTETHGYSFKEKVACENWHQLGDQLYYFPGKIKNKLHKMNEGSVFRGSEPT